MGNCLEILYPAFKSDLMRKHNFSSDKVHTLCMRWKKLRNPERMTPNEFQKAIIQNDEIKINYKKYYDSGEEIEAIDLLTNLVILSNGKLDERLKTLFHLYCFDEQSSMTPYEFVNCLNKSMEALCEIASIEQYKFNKSQIEVYVQEVSQGEPIDLDIFKAAVVKECYKFSEIFQESYRYLRTVSTIIVENPFPVISYLQKGNLFLGKYEIINLPDVIKDISSIYKQKYKHALLSVKPMLHNTGINTFELIYVTGIQGDKNFRQNYFREIVLKNKINSEAITEFGELPGGLLYKRISTIEIAQMTLKEYFSGFKLERLHSNWYKPCMSEKDVIKLGLNLFQELEKLHKIGVIHSNINPTSVYLIEGNIEKLAFLDLELAIWDPIEILGSESPYFQQLPEDKYDTTFRDEDFLSPEHKELAEEYRKTSKIPKQNIAQEGDIYSIGALLYMALTGEAPKDFSLRTANHPDHTSPRELLVHWDCPTELQKLVISNGMCSFLLKILAFSPAIRFRNINEAREELLNISHLLDSIPIELMQSLEHVETDQSRFNPEYTCDLRSFEMNDFALEYLIKFVYDSKIPNLRIFGGCLPLLALKMNEISILDLSNQKLYSEELRILTLFLEKNESLQVINLSNNPLNTRHDSKKNGYSIEFTLKKFIEALTKHVNLTEFRMGKVEIGAKLSEKLCKALSCNENLEVIDLGFCNMEASGIKGLCELCHNLKKLSVLTISGNNFGNEGAKAVAELIKHNHNIVEIDISSNNISNQGAQSISESLINNFAIQHFSIHDNTIDQNETEAITHNVNFNTYFTSLKSKNEKFKEYAYNLIAESIKKWVTSHKFVVEKLRAKLLNPVDEVDLKLCEILLDSQGNLNLKPIPMKYTYNPGEGTVHFETKTR